MNQEAWDERLVDYLLGYLDQTEAEAIELAIREKQWVRERFFELQANFELMMREGESRPTLRDLRYDLTRARVFQRLGLNEPPIIPAVLSGAGSSAGGVQWSLWAVFGGVLAAAAVLILGLSLGGGSNALEMPADIPLGPALVVYDITDEASIDFESIQSGQNIRELIFINHDGYDGLLRAESYAEQLWAEYLELRGREPESIKGRGFLVLDLVEKQGFAGFYADRESLNSSPRTAESLWFTSGNAKEVVVGPIDAEPGVFYFQLDGDKVKLLTLNEFLPVARPSPGTSI